MRKIHVLDQPPFSPWTLAGEGREPRTRGHTLMPWPELRGSWLLAPQMAGGGSFTQFRPRNEFKEFIYYTLLSSDPKSERRQESQMAAVAVIAWLDEGGGQIRDAEGGDRAGPGTTRPPYTFGLGTWRRLSGARGRRRAGRPPVCCH